jgi:general stress protein 26
MGTKEHKQKIWELINPIGVGMLTIQDDMNLDTRPMQLIQNEYDNKLWFFTNKKSAHADLLKNNKSANITFANPKDGTFVSMSGEAAIVTNDKLTQNLWNDYASAWFADEDNVALIEMKVDSGEHWDRKVDKETFKEQIKDSMNSSKVPNVTEHEKF